MAAREQYIQLARALPAQLQRFLARYPPASILGGATSTTTTTRPSSLLSSASASASTSTAGPATTTEPNSPTSTATSPAAAAVAGLAAAQQAAQPATPHTAYQADRPDPFGWLKHPVTGRWLGPAYSARRQAQLFQLARRHGVEELLPPSARSPAARLERRVALGLRVKGTGVGQRVKGHAHERGMETKYVFPCLFVSRVCAWAVDMGCATEGGPAGTWYCLGRWCLWAGKSGWSVWQWSAMRWEDAVAVDWRWEGV